MFKTLNNILLCILCLSYASVNLGALGLVKADYHLECTASNHPTKLIIEISDPKPGDDCDIIYNDDCGLTKGLSTLITELDSPTSKQQPNQKHHIGVISSPFSSDLFIDSEGKYQASLNSNFRNELSSGSTIIEVESFLSDTPPFNLTCNQL